MSKNIVVVEYCVDYRRTITNSSKTENEKKRTKLNLCQSLSTLFSGKLAKGEVVTRARVI